MQIISALSYIVVGGLMAITPSPVLQVFGLFGVLLGCILFVDRVARTISDLLP